MNWSEIDVSEIDAALATAEVEEKHAKEDQCQVNGFGAQVLLVEHQRPHGEGDHDAATTYHRDNADHGSGKAQGIEIGEVSHREEERDERDG